MANLPKLKVWIPGNPAEITMELEQARESLFGREINLLITAEGQSIHSYYELSELANKEANRDKEFLELTVLPVIEGG